MTIIANKKSINILLATSEIYPLVKTGGLADFSYGLARSLKRLKTTPIVILPAYRQVLQQLPKAKKLVTVDAAIAGKQTSEILQAYIPGTQIPIWLLATEELFDRPGSPYAEAGGSDWPDNAKRFNHFAKVTAAIACGQIDLGWKPDIVHCNDWQTGLIPAYINSYSPSECPRRPATVFSIHNLAYQGNFSRETFDRLQLPWHWWSFDKLEFHDQLSFIKGGLVWGDKITTVSPQYAKEIMTEASGCGLDGLLRHRRTDLSGILNGVDYKTWNPAKDPLIHQRYKKNALHKKSMNKNFWLETHWSKSPKLNINKRRYKNQPLFGFIGRLCYQKGIDRLLAAIEHTAPTGACWAILGSGDQHHEQALAEITARYPAQISLTLDYDEEVAHQIEASSDIFLMPSVYEPCGLNQMYSLKYATLPIVSNTGGLVDTIINYNGKNIGSATGFVFDGPSLKSLLTTLDHAVTCYHDQSLWQRLQKNAVNCDFSWDRSAEQYLQLYQSLLSPAEDPVVAHP
ncbi:starch synthase [Gammaproteobacteria bacterium 50_400_T64]|nr:starch synthase [Gammaproteobacteria bacterium 50_400_T64]